MDEKLKKGYFGKEHEDADWGQAIVANNLKQAKKLFWAMCQTEGYGECTWIDLRVTWQRNAKVDALPIGVVQDLRVGLESGIFAHIDDFPCDVCDRETLVEMHNGKVMCGLCYEKDTPLHA